MVRLNRYTSVQDIIQWEVKIPGCGVAFLYKRNPNGTEFFTCVSNSSYYNTRRVYMSPDELLCICKHTEAWLTDYFNPNAALNYSKTVISQSIGSKGKQLTLTFSKHANTIGVEVRLWERRNGLEVFERTSHGFFISGIQQLKCMSEVGGRVIRHMKRVNVLSNYVSVVHYMLYEEYYAFKKMLVDDSETVIKRFLDTIDVQKFIHLLRKRWLESIYADDPEAKRTIISERELFTYVLSDGIDEIRIYMKDNDVNDWHICKDLQSINPVSYTHLRA